MIFVRRAITVPLLLILTLVLAVTLVAQRVNTTLLSSEFHQDQLTAIGAYDAVHDEVLPRALDSFLTTQDEKIPDNLEGITLPTDAESQATVLEFGRATLAPQYLETQANAVIEALVAYLRGESDQLDLAVTLNEPLRAGFLERDAGTSEFERSWETLDLSNVAIAGLARGVEIPELTLLQNPQSLPVLTRLRAAAMPLEEAVPLVATVYEGAPDATVSGLTDLALHGGATTEDLESLKTFLTTAYLVQPESAQALVAAVAADGPASDDLLTILLGDERDDAIRWFEGELFRAAGELAAYLAGDSEHFAIHIEFDRYPELAPVIAGAPNSDRETLLRDGFRLNDVDIQRELDAGDDLPVESLDEARAIFTVSGRSFGLEDFRGDDESGAAGDGGGLDLERVRNVTAPAARWAIPAGATAILWLAAAVGFLGGRAWWSRGAWAAAAVAVPATLLAILAGPVYGATLAPRLADAMADQRAEVIAEDASWAPLALRGLDQIELIANQQASAIGTTSLLIALVTGALGTAAVGWHLYAVRRARLEPSATPSGPRDAATNEADQPARAA